VSITLAIAILPAIGLIYLFKKWDQKRPEPPGMIRNAMILGALSCVPAVIIELALTAVIGEANTNAQGSFLKSFVVAAGTEEALKLAVVLLFFWRKPEFNETMDGILYTAAASLGFALLENVLYAGGNLILGLARAISAVPLHATCSGLMGYFVGIAKMRGSAGTRIALGYFIAVMIHGVYDWAVFSGGMYGFGEPSPLLGFAQAVGIVIVAAIMLRITVKRALAEDDALLGAHSRPLAVAMPAPYAYAQMPGQMQGHPHAPYANPYAPPHHAPPPPYGMHQPYAGHVPQPHAPPAGFHPQQQPHQYPPQHAHAHAPQQGYGQNPYPQQQQQGQPPPGYPPGQAPPGWGKPPQGWGGGQ
jgi:protease PrsW